MNYRVTPGLYRFGRPETASPVLVSANYKLSFDHLRRALAGRDVWILVLDTDGVNVWCAAGKGPFGTAELLGSLDRTGLRQVVSHRTLVLPQLGAVGIAAHEVRKGSGFKVVYGPVRAEDLPAFLDRGLKADPVMRRVSFTLRERLALVPMELVPAVRGSVPVVAAAFLLGGLGWWGYSVEALIQNGSVFAVAYLGALVAGAVVTPILLPWLPGRAFSMKGALPGLVWTVLFLLLFGGTASFAPPPSWAEAAWFFLLPAVSAFFAMNFTGSSPITSLSGVRKEMRRALPLQIIGGVGGVLLWLAGHFQKGAL